MYQGVCTHSDQERHVVETLLVDAKQNPDTICDVKRRVLEMIRSPDIKFTNPHIPRNDLV